MDQVEGRLAGQEGKVVESRHSDNKKKDKWKIMEIAQIINMNLRSKFVRSLFWFLWHHPQET